MPPIARTYVDLIARTKPYDQGLARATARSKRFRRDMIRTFKGVAGAMGVYMGAQGVIGFVRSAITAAAEQEKTLAQLRAGLESTNAVSGQTIQSLTEMSAEMQRLTTFSNETVEAAQGILLSFTKIQGDVFPKTIKAAANVATRMGTDLRSAVVQLGKALNDPVANLGELSRAGIQFTKDQKATIKSLWEGGRAAAAQTIILDELETQYGNTAKAVGETLAGQLAKAKNEWDDLKKSVGQALAPIALAGVRTARETGKTFADIPRVAKQAFEDAIGSQAAYNERIRNQLRMQQALLRKDAREQAVVQIEIAEQAAETKIAIANEEEKKKRAIAARERKQMFRNAAATTGMVGTITGALRDLTAINAEESKKQFNLHKQVAIADTIVNTSTGIMRAWADMPTWAAAPMTALIAATGAAQIAAIRSTHYGGGGGIPTGGAGALPDTAAPAGGGGGGAAGPGQDVSITLVGETFGAAQIRDLIESINEQQADGVTLRVAG